MKLSRNLMILVMSVCWWTRAALGTVQPLQGLRVPVDFYLDGTLKHELQAKEARVLEDGTIEAQDVIFRLFTQEGREDVTIQAAQATVDRVGLRGHSARPVSLMRERLLLTGEGFEWNGTAETIRILRRVRLTFPSEMFRERIGDPREAENQE